MSRPAIVLLVIALVATTISTGIARAAVPQFPDNIVVFPDRDMVSLEGYQDHVHQPVTIQVRRGADLIGQVTGEIEEGDHAYEVNHPGGGCWGDGAPAELKVTPDIRPGDKVIVLVGGQVDDHTVLDAYVTAPATLTGTTLTVSGHIAEGMPRDFFEQRIVNPDLKDTPVGRRTVRATTTDWTVEDGYRSRVQFDGTTFTAVYEFGNEATARVAAAGQLRAMAWEASDGAANRQGLTIAEFDEVNGPGMGGCPNGPHAIGPAAPSDVTAVRSSDGRSIALTWTPARGVPGGDGIAGYRATAVSELVAGSNEQTEIGKRVAGSSATGTTITGLDGATSYTVELRSVSTAGVETSPPRLIRPLQPGEDTVAPEVSVDPAGGAYPAALDVTLTADDADAEIYYTVDGSAVLEGDMPSADAPRYKDPIRIEEEGTTVLKWVAIDRWGNLSTGSQTYVISDAPAPVLPGKPDAPTVETGDAQATISWQPPNRADGDPPLTGYTARMYQGTRLLQAVQTDHDVTTASFGDLIGGTTYRFTVQAHNANGPGPESSAAEGTPSVGLVARAGEDQQATRGSTVTLDGSGSTGTGLSYRWEQVTSGPTDPNRVTLAGADTTTPSFTYPFLSATVTNTPLEFVLTVRDASGAERSDTVTVSQLADRIVVAGGRYKQGSELRVEGTGTTIGATVTLTDAQGRLIGTAPVEAAVAPLTGGVWSLRLKPAPAAFTNPITATSNGGGQGSGTLQLR